LQLSLQISPENILFLVRAGLKPALTNLGGNYRQRIPMQQNDSYQSKEDIVLQSCAQEGSRTFEELKLCHPLFMAGTNGCPPLLQKLPAKTRLLTVSTHFKDREFCEMTAYKPYLEMAT